MAEAGGVNSKPKKRPSKNYKNSSQNSLKHGLTATKPPVLLTEDKETYALILQELAEEYQPATATESMYVEKMAMGRLRLYRLWKAEAARANKEMMQYRYPSLNKRGGFHETWEFGALPDEISGEKLVLEGLIRNLEFDIDPAQVNSKPEVEVLSGLLASVTRTGVLCGDTWKARGYSLDDVRCSEIKSAVQHLREWLTPPEDDEDGDWEDEEEEYIKPHHVEFGVALQKASQLLGLLQVRREEVEAEGRVFVQNHESSKGIVQDPEILSRYERHINRQLKDDIEMLKTLRESRDAT